MKSTAILLLATGFLLSCSQSGIKSETATDTLSTAASDAPVSPEAKPQPVNNFPDYSSATLTDNEFDAAITREIDGLIAANSTRKFQTYQAAYSREGEYEGDNGPITETQEVTERWFFDTDHKLRAYSKKFNRSGEGRTNSVLVGLFANDSLLALSDWRLEDGQIGMTYHKKLLASRCPKCGVNTNQEAGDAGKVVDVLSGADLDEAQGGVITSLNDLFSESVWANAQKSGEGYGATEEAEGWSDGQTKGKPYTVQYTMSADLYGYLKFKSLIELFNSSDSDIPKATVDYFIGAEEMASYSTKELLESEPAYFLLYKKFKQVGGGVEELYALSFTKQGEMVSNVLLGSSFPDSGPDGDGEEYEYSYDQGKHLLKVISTTITWDKGTQRTVRKDVSKSYKMNREGTLSEL